MSLLHLWESLKLCSTLCYDMDCTVHGILQARMLESAAVPFSSGSSPPRNQTRVSCIAGRFFTSWATSEAWYFVIPGILQTFSSLYLLWWPMISDLCSFMIVWRAMKWSESHSVVSDSLWPHGLYSPWNSPGQNIGVGSLYFHQGIFPTQESNWGLLHRRQILYQLSYQGSPRGHEPCP